MPICPRCGQENPEIARFCLACAAPLGAVEEAREVRKVVTVIFGDVTGSTALGERLDPESLRQVMGRYFEAARSVIEAHGGTVEKFIGDAVMAVFGVPVLHEDDALRAVRAAAEMRDAIAALGRELEREFGASLAVRIGVNTGEVVTGTAERLATGDAVNVAARLEQAADPGDILLGAVTFDLVRDAVECELVPPLELKGKAEPVAAHRLVAVRPDAAGRARRLDSPLVGRDHERRLLEDAFERSQRERACHLFTVLGPAGVGKSRLVLEFLAGAGTAAALVRGRCLPYGDGITYWPLAEALSEAAGLRTDDDADEAARKLGALLEDDPDRDLVAARVAEPLGIAPATSGREEIFWAVRRLLENVARRRPLVAVFDDLHWAEPTFLDLVEHVADWSRDAPILLLCLARPELLDARPHWGGGKLNATSVLLEPLTEDESERLIANLLGEAPLEEAARARIAQAAEGNPLFVEEMIGMLIDEGLLRRANGGWVAAGDLASVRVPPTIQALLAARLDRLDGPERATIERAAVEGKVFHLGAVAELSRDADRHRVGPSLMALVRKELVRPDHPQLPGEDAFRFRHMLIRDAAYESISKELRAELHERFAGWLAGKAADGFEADEIVGYHLEQAARYRDQLGRRDERTAELARRAAELLAAAGRRVHMHDSPAALNLFARAAELYQTDDPARLTVLVELGAALAWAFEFERAQAVLEDAVGLAEATGNRREELRARLELGEVLMSTAPEGSTERLQRLTETAVAEFEAAGDEAGLARAWAAIAQVHHIANRLAERAEAYERAIHHARRAGDPRIEVDSLAALSVSYSIGPVPVEEALAKCRARKAEAPGRPRVQGAYDCALAFLEALRGNFAEARELVAAARSRAEEIGLQFGLVATGEWACTVELMAGEGALAEEAMRPGYDLLQRADEKAYLSTMACHMGEAVYLQGRCDEAARYAEIAESLGASDDVATQIGWRQLRAKVLADRGDHELAERLAREAVALAAATDALVWHAEALVDLARVLAAAGQAGDAAAAVAEAIELYDRKGATALVRRARALLAR